MRADELNWGRSVLNVGDPHSCGCWGKGGAQWQEKVNYFLLPCS